MSRVKASQTNAQVKSRTVQTEKLLTENQACGPCTMQIDVGDDYLSTVDADDEQEDATEDPEWEVEHETELDSDDDSEEESDTK